MQREGRPRREGRRPGTPVHAGGGAHCFGIVKRPVEFDQFQQTSGQDDPAVWVANRTEEGTDEQTDSGTDSLEDRLTEEQRREDEQTTGLRRIDVTADTNAFRRPTPLLLALQQTPCLLDDRQTKGREGRRIDGRADGREGGRTGGWTCKLKGG